MSNQSKDVNYRVLSSWQEIENLPKGEFIYYQVNNKILAVSYSDIRRIILLHGHKKGIIALATELVMALSERLNRTDKKGVIYL